MTRPLWILHSSARVPTILVCASIIIVNSYDRNARYNFEDEPLMGFMYLAFTRMPGGGTVGDSGLCACVLCLSSAIASLRLLKLQSELSATNLLSFGHSAKLSAG